MLSLVVCIMFNSAQAGFFKDVSAEIEKGFENKKKSLLIQLEKKAEAYKDNNEEIARNLSFLQSSEEDQNPLTADQLFRLQSFVRTVKKMQKENLTRRKAALAFLEDATSESCVQMQIKPIFGIKCHLKDAADLEKYHLYRYFEALWMKTSVELVHFYKTGESCSFETVPLKFSATAKNLKKIEKARIAFTGSLSQLEKGVKNILCDVANYSSGTVTLRSNISEQINQANLLSYAHSPYLANITFSQGRTSKEVVGVLNDLSGISKSPESPALTQHITKMFSAAQNNLETGWTQVLLADKPSMFINFFVNEYEENSLDQRKEKLHTLRGQLTNTFAKIVGVNCEKLAGMNSFLLKKIDNLSAQSKNKKKATAPQASSKFFSYLKMLETYYAAKTQHNVEFTESYGKKSALDENEPVHLEHWLKGKTVKWMGKALTLDPSGEFWRDTFTKAFEQKN